MAKVMVGIPIRGKHAEPGWKTQQCLKYMQATSKHEIEVYYSRGQQITQNSQEICRRVLDKGFDYLLYTGDDIIFPPWALDRMIDHDVDFVSGVCTWATPPYWPVAIKMQNDEPRYFLITRNMVQQNALVELDMVGSGFIVVKRKVLEAVVNLMNDKVYRSIPKEYRWLAPVPFFPVTFNYDKNYTLSSDYSFCHMARKAGQRIFMDCGIVCRHRFEGEFDIEDHWEHTEKYGFSREEEKWFGDRVEPVSPRHEKIYWGDFGEPVPIAVTSVGNVYHASRHILPILRGEAYPITETKNPQDVKSGYIIGFHIGQGDDSVKFENYMAWAAQFPEKCLIHWVGSDILRIEEWATPERLNTLKEERFVHLVEDERMYAEFIEKTGIRPHVVAIPTVNDFGLKPMPQNFSVAVYYPRHRHRLHYGDIVEEVIKRMPEVEFRLYHLTGERPDFNYPNMAWLGSLVDPQYENMLARTSCMLRLAEHDGRSFGLVEMALMGRPIITNIPGWQYAIQTPDPPTIDSVIAAIRKAKEMSLEPNLEMANHYRKINSGLLYNDAVASLAGLREARVSSYDYHDYWEGRYSDGPRGAGGPVPLGEEATFINEKIREEVQETGAQTVLDVGCGSMVRWDKLPVKPANYIGVDVSPQAIVYAQERHPKATFFVADLTLDTIPPADAVIGIDVLPHIKPEHFQAVIRKIFGAAKKLVVLKIALNVADGNYQHNVPLPHDWNMPDGWSGPILNIPGNNVAKLFICKKTEVAEHAAS